MAASIRVNNFFRIVVGNAILRTKPLFFSRISACLYRRKETTRNDALNHMSRRMIASSVIRWDEMNEESESNKPKQQEPTEEELLQAIEYLNSEDYIERYGDKPVWANYKRNHKGRIPPMKTRRMCIRGKSIAGNPCPICRDSNLVLHYKNVKLLEQFICPHSWNIYSTYRTGVCRKQYKKLCATIDKARKYGLLPYSVPYTDYQYEDYYQDETPSKEKKALVDI